MWKDKGQFYSVLFPKARGTGKCGRAQVPMGLAVSQAEEAAQLWAGRQDAWVQISALLAANGTWGTKPTFS